MKKWTPYVTLIAILMLIALVSACTSQESSDPTPTTETVATEAVENTQDYTGKKVVFVNSYHEGDFWSDRIESGFSETMKDTGIEPEYIRLNTKNQDEDFGMQAGKDAYDRILEVEPDVVVACDDNAQSYLVVPHMMEGDIPVVFCGVNWDAEVYGYPTDNITGMIEIELIDNLVDHIKQFADGDSIAYIGTTSTTDAKNAEVYNERFFDGKLKVYAAADYAEFKEMFLDAQANYDMALIGNFYALSDWDKEDAEAFTLENTKIPMGTVMVGGHHYTLITLEPIPEEQGEWAADAALQILDGTSVADIAVAENKRGNLWVNLNLATVLDVEIPVALLRQAETYGGEE